jgi:threonine synthase
VAAYCARAGIDCEIFVPAENSPGKLAQIRLYGARLNLVPGSREDTSRAVWMAAQSRYYASHVWNPYFFHGTKTWAYEVCEQLGWQAPDAVVLPAGNGTLLLGAAIGFAELYEAGIIKRLPRIIGVQSANCAPLFHAFHTGKSSPETVPTASTLAEGIAIAIPARGAQILRGVRESSGTFLMVSEMEIASALKQVMSMGYYIEPTSAAVIAGLLQYLKNAPENEQVVSVFTGHGLKATEKLTKLYKDE